MTSEVASGRYTFTTAMNEREIFLEKFRSRLMTVILDGDHHDFVANTLEYLVVKLDVLALEHVVMKKQNLPLVDQSHSHALLRGLQILLLDHLPDFNPSDFSNPMVILEAHLNAYQGLPIHMAAALGRTLIVDTMVNIADKNELDGVNLLKQTDSCDNSALCVAMENGRSAVAWNITNRLSRWRCPRLIAESIVRHSVARVTSRVRDPFQRCRLTDSHVLDDIFMYDEQCTMITSTSLLWLVFNVQEGLLRHELERRLANNGTVCSLEEPAAFHYGVYVYSTYNLDIGQDTVLNLLHLHRRVAGNRGPNDISVLKIGHKVEMNGTAAHFAVAGYHPGHLQQIHPGFWDRDRLAETPASRRTDGSSFVQMLTHLRNVYDVNLSEPNHDQKTPLDFLPPDADPRLINVLVNFNNMIPVND